MGYVHISGEENEVEHRGGPSGPPPAGEASRQSTPEPARITLVGYRMSLLAPNTYIRLPGYRTLTSLPRALRQQVRSTQNRDSSLPSPSPEYSSDEEDYSADSELDELTDRHEECMDHEEPSSELDVSMAELQSDGETEMSISELGDCVSRSLGTVDDEWSDGET